jgi:opacity protein-like surface antigen
LNTWWIVGLSSGLALLGTASHASAGDFEAGARFGYGIPRGDAGDDTRLSDGISGMVPLQLDLGYRASPAFSIGGYAMYGFGFTGDDFSRICDNADRVPGLSASCSARDVRLGIQAQYHFLPKKKVDPWLGAGLGYEWLKLKADVSGGVQAETSNTSKGFELNLQGGLDFEVAPGLALGPFLSFSIGRYSSFNNSFNSSCSFNECDDFTTENGDIDEVAPHQWLLLGLRGTFVVGDDSTTED